MVKPKCHMGISTFFTTPDEACLKVIRALLACKGVGDGYFSPTCLDRLLGDDSVYDFRILGVNGSPR